MKSPRARGLSAGASGGTRPSIRVAVALLTALTWAGLRSDAGGAPASLENGRLRVSVSATGALALTDQTAGVTWASDRPGWVTVAGGDGRQTLSLATSEVAVTGGGDQLLLTFAGLSGDEVSDASFRMQVRLALAPSHLDLEIASVQSGRPLQAVEYPAHLLTVPTGIDEGYVVVPNAQGLLFPSRYDAGFMRYGQNVWRAIADVEKWWSFESGMLNMPWFGARRGRSSILAWVPTPADAMLHVIGNAVVGDEGRVVDTRNARTPGTRRSSLTPVWRASKGELAYPRRLRLEPVADGYVGMAKRYREYARQTGRLVTLREKIAQNPEHARIVGAPDIKIYVYTNRLDEPYLRAWSEPVLDGYARLHTTFDQVTRMVRDLGEMGVDKALVVLAGWNHAGYDREHVDMWPPAAPAGGIAALARAAEAAQARGYLFALHDNYHDLYPDAPSYDERHVLRNADGSLYVGGVWDGGRCHRICPAEQRPFLDRNLDLVQQALGLNAYYLDVTASTSPNECHDPRHPLTRQGDLDHRLGLLQALRDRGLVVGSERGTDWAVPAAAFFEGLHGGGTGYHRGVSYREGLTVPLFHLVYHDCIVAYWQHGTPFGREDHANHVLHDLLTAQPSSWSLVHDQWEDLKPLIQQTSELLGPLHEQTAHHPMVDHEFLTDDHMVQRSEFGDGTRVWVNYGITSYRDEEGRIAPKGFRVRVPGRPEEVGVAGRKILFADSRESPAERASRKVETPSGLVYEVVEEGTGPIADPGQLALIHERTTLADGTVITDTWAINHPVRFLLGGGQVIDGVDEGVTGMRVGERRRLVVPPTLSHRSVYPDNLRPGDTLYYDVTLLQVTEPDE